MAGLKALYLRSRKWGLTIRSRRDRFAARLTRYRVPPSRAAKLSGLTQVLAPKEKSCDVL